MSIFPHFCLVSTLQWCAIEMHYINGVALSQDFIPEKSCHGLGFLAPNRYEIDLSNEVINLDFVQEAAIKVGC